MKKLTKRFKDIHVEITFADVNEYDTAKGALTDSLKKSSIRTAKRKKTVKKKRGVRGKGNR